MAFAERWRLATEMGTGLLEEEADRRGRDGVSVDEVLPRNMRGPRRYSDGLLLARLKALRPELYRESEPCLKRARAPRGRYVYDSGGVTVVDFAPPRADARSEIGDKRKWHS